MHTFTIICAGFVICNTDCYHKSLQAVSFVSCLWLCVWISYISSFITCLYNLQFCTGLFGLDPSLKALPPRAPCGANKQTKVFNINRKANLNERRRKTRPNHSPQICTQTMYCLRKPVFVFAFVFCCCL